MIVVNTSTAVDKTGNNGLALLVVKNGTDQLIGFITKDEGENTKFFDPGPRRKNMTKTVASGDLLLLMEWFKECAAYVEEDFILRQEQSLSENEHLS